MQWESPAKHARMIEFAYQRGPVTPSACVKVLSRGFQGRRRVTLLGPDQVCQSLFIAGQPTFGHEAHVQRIGLLRRSGQERQSLTALPQVPQQRALSVSARRFRALASSAQST